jgi:hypothetical protein
MNTQSISAEQKAILKTGIKFLEKVNPNTLYQHKLKSDIKYTINALSVDDIELWIACTKILSENYSYILTLRGFSPLTEETIRQRGKLWIYNNLTSMSQTLQQALSVECLRDSIEEGIIEYVVEKVIR